jgi:hypothetical protein
MRIPVLFSVLAVSIPVCLSADQDPTTLPQVEVTANRVSDHEPVGPYSQPKWTTKRRFPTTRVYLQRQPGEFGLEQWWRGRFYDGGVSKHRFQEEIEIGLPHRFQFDFYWNWAVDKDSAAGHDSFALELRHAFADWGKLPLNPTVYAEYKFVNEDADVYEAKLLLGDNLGQRANYGINLIWEAETGGEKKQEWGGSVGLSYVLVEEKLSAGFEVKYMQETVAGSRSDPEHSLVAGPSIQWRPTSNTHLDVTPLFGLTEDSPNVEAYVVFGIDFGGGIHRYHPTSVRSH